MNLNYKRFSDFRRERDKMLKTQLWVLLISMVIGFAVGALCWTYTLNTWLVYLGKEASIVWWQGGLIGFVPWIGHASIPAAVVTWVLMLFL